MGSWRRLRITAHTPFAWLAQDAQHGSAGSPSGAVPGARTMGSWRRLRITAHPSFAWPAQGAHHGQRREPPWAAPGTPSVGNAGNALHGQRARLAQHRPHTLRFVGP
jgi:hypothetical protein